MRYQGPGQKRLVLDLNFLPVTLDGGEMKGFRTDYPHESRMEELSKEVGPEWSLWRDGSSVYLWSLSDAMPPCKTFKATEEKLKVADNPGLVSRMILDAFERELIRMGFTPIGKKRKGFVNFSKGNFLSKIINSIDARVGVYPRISLNSFFTSFKKGEIVFGIVVDIDTLVRINVPLSDLVARGMDCRGLYLMFRDEDSRFPDLWSFNGGTAGKLSAVSGNTARMTDIKDAKLQDLSKSVLFLEPKLHNLFLYMRAIHPQDAASASDRLHKEVSNFSAPKMKWEMVEGFRRKFFDGDNPRAIPAASGLQVRVAHAYQSREESEAFRLSSLLQADFNHDYGSWKISKWADGGLRKYGPYDREIFSKKNVEVLLVSPLEHKGEVEKFVKQFENGFQGQHQNTYNGFLRKYHLKSIGFDEKYFSASGTRLAEDYQAQCLECLTEGRKYDLAFLIIRHEFEALPTLENPYYVAKALLLSQGIPVQEVKIQTIRKPLNNLPYVLNNIGLACYAKLGGTPYVLRAQEVVRKELVIGIGSAIDRETRLAPGKQVVGFTTVFKNNGDFLLSSCTPYCDFSDYAEKLEEVVVSSVERIAKREGYSDGEELRIIFHIFRESGKRERGAIERALKRLGRYKIEYSLLHVNDGHLFHVFDRANSNGDGTDFLAPRGVCVEIGPRERLVNFIGPKQYRRRGCPTPLRLTLDKGSTFKDLSYMCQQLYEFSFMSWRGFNPSIAPATLLYSQWIAKLNSKLRRVPNWNQNMLTTQLVDKRWFL